MPAYSTLVSIAAAFFAVNLLLMAYTASVLPETLLGARVGLLSVLFVYPLFGLLLERVPARAYLAILTTPVSITWRIWLWLTALFNGGTIGWVRTRRPGSV